MDSATKIQNFQINISTNHNTFLSIFHALVKRGISGGISSLLKKRLKFNITKNKEKQGRPCVGNYLDFPISNFQVQVIKNSDIQLD